MIYRVVIIDNGNQVSLTEQDGKRVMEGEGNMDIDFDKLGEALDKLKEAKDDRKDYSR